MGRLYDTVETSDIIKQNTRKKKALDSKRLQPKCTIIVCMRIRLDRPVNVKHFGYSLKYENIGLYISTTFALQCFNNVGWVAGRESSLRLEDKLQCRYGCVRHHDSLP